MTTYPRKLQLVAGLLLILAGGYGLTARSYGTTVEGGKVDPGVVPLLLAVCLAVLSVLIFLTANRQAPPESKETAQRRREFVTAASFFGCLVVYAALVSFVGFVLATLLAVTGILRFYFKYSVRRTMLFGGALTLACYLVFDVALNVSLP